MSNNNSAKPCTMPLTRFNFSYRIKTIPGSDPYFSSFIRHATGMISLYNKFQFTLLSHTVSSAVIGKLALKEITFEHVNLLS